jgi:transcriptional regulator with XRE-family HTH domain
MLSFFRVLAFTERWFTVIMQEYCMKETCMSRQKLKPAPLFSEPLRQLREILGKTQAEMADTIGVSLRTYAYWEAGVHAPPATKLARIQAIASEEGARKLDLAALILDHKKAVLGAEGTRRTDEHPSASIAICEQAGETVEISTDFLSAAVRGLRRKLNLSQEAMAARIGCTFAAYRQWESGRRSPSGEWLIKIMRLCPDADSLEAFGLELTHLKESKTTQARKNETYSLEPEGFMKEGNDEELREWYKQAQDVVRFLGQQKRAGNKVAAEMLRSIAQSVVRAAGLATEPGMSKARRARIIEEEIRRLEKIIE